MQARHEAVDDPPGNNLNAPQGSEAGWVEEVCSEGSGALHGKAGKVNRGGARLRWGRNAHLIRGVGVIEVGKGGPGRRGRKSPGNWVLRDRPCVCLIVYTSLSRESRM